MKMNDMTFVDVHVTHRIRENEIEIRTRRVPVKRAMFITNMELIRQGMSETVKELKDKVIVDIRTHTLAEMYHNTEDSKYDLTHTDYWVEERYVREGGFFSGTFRKERDIKSRTFIKGTNVELNYLEKETLNAMFMENVIVFEIAYRDRVENELV